MDIRIRLRPWLESRLNEGWIEGLCWIDKEKGIFKIPWKHHSKHTWTEDDAAIFKDWAVVTGRYREGIDSPDWPMWKTRLRCALNKAPDIQEVKQRHNLHCDDPFKVYRFISKTESLWRANATRNASMIFDGISPVSTMMPTPVSHIQAARKNVAPPPSNGSKRSAVFIQRINGSDSTSRPIAFIHRINEGVVIKQFQLSQQQQMQQIHPVVDSQDESNDASDFGINGGLTTDHLDIGATQEVPSCGSSDYDNYNGGHSRYLSVEGNPLGTTTIIRRLAAPNNRHSFLFQPQSHSSLSNLGVLSNNSFTHGSNVAAAGHVAFLPDVMEPEYHQLGIRIQHLNIRVKDAIINSPAAPDPIETQIPHHVSDANKAYVDLLLENMVRGIVLSATHGSIYVERMCKCAVFVYVPTSDGDHIFMRKLGRREREKIFDYDDFMQDLECYQAGQRPRPHFEIILAFGQQLRSGLSTDNLLVWCRVASCRAWFHLHKLRPLVPRGSLASVLVDQPLISVSGGLVNLQNGGGLIRSQPSSSHHLMPHHLDDVHLSSDTRPHGQRHQLSIDNLPSQRRHRFMVASTSDSLSPTNGTAVGVDSNSSGIHMGGPNDGNVIVVHSASGSHLEQFRMNRNSSNGLHMLSPVERNRRASSRAMVKIEDSGVDVDVIVDGLSEDVHQVVDADDLLHAGPHTFIMPSSNEQVVIEEGVEVPLDDCEDAEAAAVAAAEVAAADAADNDLVYSHPEEPDSDSIHHRMLTATEDFPDTPLQNDQADERSDHELSDQAQLSRVQDDTDGTEDEGRRDGGTDEVTIGQATGSPDSDCNTIRFVGRKLPSSFISRLDPHTRVVGVNRSRISSLNGVYSIDHKGLVIKNENILSDHDLSVEDGGLVAGFS